MGSSLPMLIAPAVVCTRISSGFSAGKASLTHSSRRGPVSSSEHASIKHHSTASVHNTLLQQRARYRTDHIVTPKRGHQIAALNISTCLGLGKQLPRQFHPRLASALACLAHADAYRIRDDNAWYFIMQILSVL